MQSWLGYIHNRGRLLLALVLALALAAPAIARESGGRGGRGGSVSVRGYSRKDGTYVQPHRRSAPDGNFGNNWSTRGNVNPYTGEPGTKITLPLGYDSGSTSPGQGHSPAPSAPYWSPSFSLDFYSTQDDRVCLSCRGLDKTTETCDACKGYDLTKEKCSACSGRDFTKEKCIWCSGEDFTKKRCGWCDGRGRVSGEQCLVCEGTGKHQPCSVCHGTGKKPPCLVCGGTGRKLGCGSCGGTGKKRPCGLCGGQGFVVDE